MTNQTFKIISFKTFTENTAEAKEKNAVVGSIDEISKKLMKDAGYCEDIKSTDLCKLFGDLDFDEEKPAEIINEFSQTLINGVNQTFKTNLSQDDFKYTVNDGKTNKEGKKVSSYHWVVPKIAMIKREQKDLIESIFKENSTFADPTKFLENSFFKGSKNTSATTLDGSEPIETFTSNPNTLKVSKAGRDANEPILEVE
jgi:hypothetical protein